MKEKEDFSTHLEFFLCSRRQYFIVNVDSFCGTKRTGRSSNDVPPALDKKGQSRRKNFLSGARACVVTTEQTLTVTVQ